MIYNIFDDSSNVINTIICEADFVEANYPGRYALVGPQPAPPSPPRHITQYAFRQRMTQAERVGIEIASLDNPSASMTQRQQAAALRVSMADLSQAQYVDLDLPALLDALGGLEAAGLLGAGRASEIVTAPVQDNERP